MSVPLGTRGCLRSALDFAGRGPLQLAQALSRCLFGFLITLPLVLDFQASPFIRVHGLDVGPLEFAVGRRLRSKQRRIGPAYPQLGMLRRFGAHASMRMQANRSCSGLPLSETAFTRRRIARASGQLQREDRNDQQSCTPRPRAIRPLLPAYRFAAYIGTMCRIHHRHDDRSDT